MEERDVEGEGGGKGGIGGRGKGGNRREGGCCEAD